MFEREVSESTVRVEEFGQEVVINIPYHPIILVGVMG